MREPKIKKKKATLVTKFAFIIGISVTFSVLFICASNWYASTPIKNQYQAEKFNEYESIRKVVYSGFETIYFENAKLSSFRKFMNEIIKNELVEHIGLVNKISKKYEWSSIAGLEGQKTDPENPWVNKDFAKSFYYLKKEEVLVNTLDMDKHIIVISFINKESITTLVEILKNGNIVLAGLFIVFGFLSAFILAKQVTEPIERLVIGVWEFSKGNLRYRTNIKTDDEIGILAKAFNYMAEKLDELYSSMEKKVDERTKELSSKNDQLNEAYEELKEAQSLLVHNEKMRSLGELVAGVAHELNNPINFIYGNMTHLKEYSNNLIDIISKYEKIQNTQDPEKYKEIESLKEDIDYEFLKEDILELIKSCTDGAERSKQIVLDLKDFSRLDQSLIKEIDINESIDSTLNILQNKYKDRVNIVREYGDIPKLECYAGQMNQVFMNILDNAAQAIGESGNVIIRTKQVDNELIIEFEDTGDGIEESILNQVFDPFFTTKPVGSGSGLGLSITYKIVKSHNGDIKVESEIGKGTKFTVKIPFDWQKNVENNEKNTVETEV